ncbi:acyl-CoA thioesterase FadM [Labedella gwakjiensis]|uniref:Thioesterase n=1 Tax=Labedella gwakjiensis TaxID=390269 RepID=A0A2P8GVW2_9MICO|nr:acyl-CoA thioesterase [Labedella gwakjiensis]PSL38110.1 acyl-CoA thioesterase FadM [Labedella gwakjiensis]RUQ87338.1 thioesterase [Labedella gwakjiensis]
MHLILRTLLVIARAQARFRRGRTIGHYDVGRIRLTTLPTDLDLNGHMNNGVYFSMLDLGRFELTIRSGIYTIFQKHGWYPVVASETITFRKSLKLWQRFTIESRIVGYDERAVIMDQRIVVRGEVYARAIIRARILSKSSGPVPMADVLAAVGVPPRTLHKEEWIERWADDVLLPSTRQPAPSEWD